MKRLLPFLLLSITLPFPHFLLAQLSIGGTTWGIGFGNAPRYTGIRFTLLDDTVDQINGLNISLGGRRAPAHVNGILFGALVSSPEVVNGMMVGGLGVGSRTLNGLGIGLFSAYGDTTNGICIAFSIGPTAHPPPGRTKRALPHLFNGLALGAGAYLPELNGLGLGIITFDARRLRGVGAAGFYNASDTVEGIQLGGWNASRNVIGVQIGVVNIARELHGVQIGLVNIALNNAPGTKVLPIINAHF